MPVTIHITVEGLDEMTARLNEAAGGAAREQALSNSLSNIADFMTQQMSLYAHVITGRMKSSISRGTPMGNTVDVAVTAPYAVYENARVGGIQGPHDFADRALQDTQQRAPDIVKTEFDRIYTMG